MRTMMHQDDVRTHIHLQKDVFFYFILHLLRIESRTVVHWGGGGGSLVLWFLGTVSKQRYFVVETFHIFIKNWNCFLHQNFTFSGNSSLLMKQWETVRFGGGFRGGGARGGCVACERQQEQRRPSRGADGHIRVNWCRDCC